MQKLVILMVVSFFIFTLRIIYMINTGQDSVFFDLARSIPYGDKIGHIVLFGLLTIGANLAFRLRCIHWGPVKIYIGTVFVIVFALIEEFSQAFIQIRTLDAKDLVADGIGIFIFTVLSFYLGKKYLVNVPD